MRYQLSILMRKKAIWQGSIAALLLAAGLCHAQTAPSPAEERARIRHERQVIEQALAQAEAACYQRFAVENCLSQARQTARKAQLDLRQQETAINEVERRQRSAQRASEMAERERTRPIPAPVPPRVQKAPRAAPQSPAPEPRVVTPTTSSSTERAQQARQRARQQQQKRKAHYTNQAQATAEQAAQAAKARQQYEQKNAAAAQRRAQVLQSQADAAAAGRVPAAPLSPAP